MQTSDIEKMKHQQNDGFFHTPARSIYNNFVIIQQEVMPSLPHTEFVAVQRQKGPEQLLFVSCASFILHLHFCSLQKRSLGNCQILETDQMVCLRQIHLTVSVMPPFLSSLFVNAHCLFLLIVTEVIINPFLFLCSLIQKFSKSKPFFLSHSAKCPLRNLPTHCCIWASLIPILEGLPLKRSFYFSLLGFPVFQNKNLSLSLRLSFVYF